MYRLIDHTADMALEVTARTRAGLYGEAARALVEIVCGAVENRPGRSQEDLQIEGLDEIDLLINWLREILALVNVDGKVPVRIGILGLKAAWLKAGLEVVPLAAAGGIKAEIKAVTYHRAVVERLDDGWRARVVLDI